jgi:PHD/YefM family antitoxin component YafN of YafNO toxin-antitoxin module
MLTVHPELVIDRARKPKAVLLPYAEWGRVKEALEELDDIRAYDAAKARRDEAVPFKQAVRELKKKR